VLAVVVLVLAPLYAWGAELARIDDLRVNEMRIRGFVLDREATVTIDAVAYRGSGVWEDFSLNNAWILSSDTRKPVWTLDDADSEKRSKRLREYTDEITLPKGRYEVYFSTYWPSKTWGPDVDIEGVGEAISEIVRGVFDKTFDEDDYRKAAREFEITVKGDGTPLGEKDILEYHDLLKKSAVIAFTALGDDRYETLGFSLDKPMDLQIYAVGELSKGGSYDYCWIIDTSTYKKVWELDYRTAVGAGGAKKNRVFKGVVPFQPGKYALFCVTDDSHAFGDWNSPPPHDPYFWGVTIQTADAAMAKGVKTYAYEPFSQKDVVLALTRLRDGETRSEGFALKSPSRLRVYALGEGSDDEMYDYSWMVDARTRKVVWEMSAANAEHAGGGNKNRQIDEVIELDGGEYIVYAVTDGSHSYEDWNASPPHNKDMWGVTLLLAGGKREDVSAYREDADAAILARIAMVGDSERKSAPFRMESEGAVRVYALGEGNDSDMDDYAWIEEAESGRVVWEMTYRMTKHAGGAKKNRVFDDTIRLGRGEYVVYYESDGSHSYEDWNASPPTDPAAWGVTIRLERKD
jgi:hypothetical protein